MLSSALKMSHDIYDASVPTLTCADDLIKAIEHNTGGAAVQKAVQT